MAEGAKECKNEYILIFRHVFWSPVSNVSVVFLMKVEDFTDAGKLCRERLQHQIAKRLPNPTAMECLPVLLDPATKSVATWLLEDDELLHETTSLLKEKHAEAYKACKSKDKLKQARPTGAEKSSALDVDDSLHAGDDNTEDDGEDYGGEDDDDGPGIVISGGDNREEDLAAKADEVFENWMKNKVRFGDFLFDGVAPLVPSKATGSVTFKELVSKFDTMKYYREVGSDEFPSVALLARIHFSTMINSGFQERVFSTCKNVMGSNQARLPMEHMEKKALLCQNADLIRKKII